MKNTTRILNFNGIELTLVLANKDWWIAIKPVCEALGINYKAQHKAISEDEALSQLSSLQRTTGADGKNYEMFCIPEKFIYGWLFSIKSSSPELKEYKIECYETLWNHFHGRFSALIEKIQIDEEIAEREKNLATNEDFKMIRQLEERKKKIPNRLRKMDKELLSGQTRMEI